jgi:hypothetical protein
LDFRAILNHFSNSRCASWRRSQKARSLGFEITCIAHIPAVHRRALEPMDYFAIRETWQDQTRKTDVRSFVRRLPRPGRAAWAQGPGRAAGQSWLPKPRRGVADNTGTLTSANGFRSQTPGTRWVLRGRAGAVHRIGTTRPIDFVTHPRNCLPHATPPIHNGIHVVSVRNPMQPPQPAKDTHLWPKPIRSTWPCKRSLARSAIRRRES